MRLRSTLAVVAAVVGCTVALASAASADVPIGPDQYFQGQIKGLHSGAVIYVVCPGPSNIGHPIASQPVQVVPNSTVTNGGYTGSAGTSVVASFGSTTATPQTLTFTSYNTPQDIPTTFWLPCSGDALIPFTPQPNSATAVTDYVKVSYVNLGA